jgi:hypothetical protein
MNKMKYKLCQRNIFVEKNTTKQNSKKTQKCVVQTSIKKMVVEYYQIEGDSNATIAEALQTEQRSGKSNFISKYFNGSMLYVECTLYRLAPPHLTGKAARGVKTPGKQYFMRFTCNPGQLCLDVNISSGNGGDFGKLQKTKIANLPEDVEEIATYGTPGPAPGAAVAA